MTTPHPILNRRTFLITSLVAATETPRAILHPAHAATPPRSITRDPLPMSPSIDEADRLLATQAAAGTLAAATFLVRHGTREFARAYGQARLATPFLIASPTKPMTAAAVLLLRDRHQLQLHDPVAKFLPQFAGADRAAVTIKQLLTHTSGLPDMLPENTDLRKRHAPLADFVAGTCRTPLLFPPGTKVSYQSMGILLAAAIVEKITGQSLPQFLADHLFHPLQMNATSLGLGGRPIADTARCQVFGTSDWDWNSPYWRNLGAPWGGAHSTVHDLATFIEHFTSIAPGPLAIETRREARSIQTPSLNQSWGLGWSLQPGAFGKTCSPATFGHFGSTGTVVWHDPVATLTCVLLTTKPASDSRTGLLGPVSDLVARHAQPPEK